MSARSPHPRRLSVVVAALVLGLVWNGSVDASGCGLERVLIERGWKHLTFDGLRPNTFRLTEDDTIEVISERSVSVAFLPTEVDLSAMPCLTWRWRIEAAPPPTDLGRRGEDDRAAAVVVAFPFEPERAGFWERQRRHIVGADAPGRVINYVWGGLEERGTVIESPYAGAAGPIKTLRPGDGPRGIWLKEAVDVAADFRRLFGHDAPPPAYVGVSADSDDTKSSARAEIADLRFAPAHVC